MSRIETTSVGLLVVAAVSGAAAPAALAQSSVTLNAGYFAVKGADTRVDGDVLLENLTLFDIVLDDFNDATAGGSWNVGIGEYFEASIGLGFFQRTVPSVYLDFIDEDGTEIAQDFRLRVTPLTATIRVFPFGGAPVQPYFGGGIGLYNWRYSEVGEFVDFTDFSLFQDRFVATGNDTGGVILGGIRFPVGDRYAIGTELQYHQATGTLDLEDGFVTDRIDLGGLSTQFTFQVRF